MPIQQAVGRNAPNLPVDVRTVQQLLSDSGDFPIPFVPVPINGRCDADTISFIERFQQKELNLNPPTGRVEPDSPTWYALNRTSGGSQIDARVDEALRLMRSEFVNFGRRFIADAAVRANYVARAEEYSKEIVSRVQSGKLTAEQGAAEAQQMRNGLLEAARLNNSDIGRAISEAEKATGKTMEQLLAYYSKKLFSRDFASLAAEEQDAVFLEIAKAAGRPNLRFTGLARNFGKVGKGLLIVSIALSVYMVASSDRPGREAAKQGVGLGAGLAGAAAGGALAGLACGPGAPICVGVGAFVGGIAFALGADITFDWLWD